MELKDFVGIHVLSGVDLETQSVNEDYGQEFRDAQCINFILDGTTYSIVENPDDGYRSYMGDIKISTHEISNRFSSINVLARMQEPQDDKDIIEFIDIITGKSIITVGTDFTDDYYPYFVSEFLPENMLINQ